jgi:hypothetical protein
MLQAHGRGSEPPMLVPWPGVEWIVIVPPTAARRS